MARTNCQIPDDCAVGRIRGANNSACERCASNELPLKEESRKGSAACYSVIVNEGLPVHDGSAGRRYLSWEIRLCIVTGVTTWNKSSCAYRAATSPLNRRANQPLIAPAQFANCALWHTLATLHAIDSAQCADTRSVSSKVLRAPSSCEQ
jgi:hypothetical protein